MPEGIICSSCFKSVPITNKVGEEEVCRSCKAGSFALLACFALLQAFDILNVINCSNVDFFIWFLESSPGLFNKTKEILLNLFSYALLYSKRLLSRPHPVIRV
jgi:hypothetical protein